MENFELLKGICERGIPLRRKQMAVIEGKRVHRTVVAGHGFTRAELIHMGHAKSTLAKALRQGVLEEASISKGGGMQVFFYVPLAEPKVVEEKPADEPEVAS